MSWTFKTALRGFVTNGAETNEAAADPRFRGRNYAIPFDRVWHAALALAQGGLPRWKLLEADDYEGVIQVEIAAARLRPLTRVTIRIGLGVDAQTRVDMTAHAPDQRGDLGRSARAVILFCNQLDRTLAGMMHAPVTATNG